MNTVYVNSPNESWVVDRQVNEWYEHNTDMSVTDVNKAHVVWLYADWCWTRIPRSILLSKKVLTTVHHIVPEKFGQPQLTEFRLRDAITMAYHVPNVHTRDFIAPLTTKPIHVICYWGNQLIFKRTSDKETLRKKHVFPQNAYIIGSAQRDTEGAGISSEIYLPKLEKGPDILADFIIAKHKETNNVHAVLAGWRRQYMISRLHSAGVPFSYLEMLSHNVLNEIYQTLDLYPVTSRYEGGPQSLIEAGLVGVPVVSRDMGIASAVLPQAAINDDVSKATPTIPNVDDLKLPRGFAKYRSLIQSL